MSKIWEVYGSSTFDPLMNWLIAFLYILLPISIFKSNSSLSFATTMESAMMLHWVFENQSKTLAGTLKNLDISVSHQFRILLWGLRENLGSFLQMDQNQKFKSSYDLFVLNWVSTKTFMLCKSGMKWNRKRSCFAKAIQCFILNIE